MIRYLFITMIQATENKAGALTIIVKFASSSERGARMMRTERALRCGGANLSAPLLFPLLYYCNYNCIIAIIIQVIRRDFDGTPAQRLILNDFQIWSISTTDLFPHSFLLSVQRLHAQCTLSTLVRLLDLFIYLNRVVCI